MADSDVLALFGAGEKDAASLVRARLADAGLVLAEADVRALDARRRESLAALGRVELGAGPLPVLADEFVGSPYLEQDRLAWQLGQVQDAFLELRDSVDVVVPDAELAHALRVAFDDARGDVDALWGVGVADVLPTANEPSWHQDPYARDPWADIRDQRPAEELL